MHSRSLPLVAALVGSFTLTSTALAQAPARFYYPQSTPGSVRGLLWERQTVGTPPPLVTEAYDAIDDTFQLGLTGGSAANQGAITGQSSLSDAPVGGCAWTSSVFGGSGLGWSLTAGTGSFTYAVAAHDLSDLSVSASSTGTSRDPIQQQLLVRAGADHFTVQPDQLSCIVPLGITKPGTISVFEMKAYRTKSKSGDVALLDSGGGVTMFARLFEDLDANGLPDLGIPVAQWVVGAGDNESNSFNGSAVGVGAGRYALVIDVERSTSDHLTADACAGGGSVVAQVGELASFSIRIQ